MPPCATEPAVMPLTTRSARTGAVTVKVTAPELLNSRTSLTEFQLSAAIYSVCCPTLRLAVLMLAVSAVDDPPLNGATWL